MERLDLYTYRAQSNPSLLYALILGSCLIQSSASPIIRTVAGYGVGEGVPATSAFLASPLGITSASDGSVYVADSANFCVRKIANGSGVITTAFGNGVSGTASPSMFANETMITAPGDVTMDASGNLVVATETFIWRVLPNRRFSALIGTGSLGNAVDGAPATSSRVYSPRGISFDRSGNLYYTQTGYENVMVVFANGTVVRYAGNGDAASTGDGLHALNASVYEPVGTSVDAMGSLYVVENYGHKVRKVWPNGTIITVAGKRQCGFTGDGGPATSASLCYPTSCALDLEGNLVVADNGNERIRIIYTNGTIRTLAGKGGRAIGADGSSALATGLPSLFSISVGLTGDIYATIDAVPGYVLRIAPNNAIYRFAGNGDNSASGDGLPATLAQLNVPSAVTQHGNSTCFTDTSNHCVRCVYPNGTIYSFVGSSQAGYGGDYGPATSASLNYPRGVASSIDKTMFIADTSNNRVRSVTPNGLISTVAGTGIAAMGAGMYGDGGPATLAQFNDVAGITLDNTNALYIADNGNHRIRKLWPNGTLTAFAGGGTACAAPNGDHGPATLASLCWPSQLSNYTNGSVVILERCTIRRVLSNGTIIPIAGTWPGCTLYDPTMPQPMLVTNLASPVALATDASGVIYVADGCGIRKVLSNGTLLLVSGTGICGYTPDGVLALDATLYYPNSIALDNSYNLYITERYRVRVMYSNGILGTLAGSGACNSNIPDATAATSAPLCTPGALVLTSKGILLYESDYCSCRLLLSNGTLLGVAGLTKSCGFAGDGGSARAAKLAKGAALAYASDGSVYMSDGSRNRIRRVSPNGTIDSVAGSECDGCDARLTSLYSPADVATYGSSLVYIADTANCVVRRLHRSNGSLTVVAGIRYSCSPSASNGVGTSIGLGSVTAVTVDANGTLYFIDNSYVRKLVPNGTLTRIVAGQAGFSGDGGLSLLATLSGPLGIAASPTGEICVSDTVNNRIRCIYSTGIITTVAGTGGNGMMGDGGDATAATLSGPRGIAFNTNGTLLIADAWNNRVRSVSWLNETVRVVPSFSPSKTPSSSPSLTRTASVSSSNSRSPSASRTATASTSVTRSSSRTSKVTASSSKSEKTTASTSARVSQSTSPTTTQSATSTYSPSSTMPADAMPPSATASTSPSATATSPPSPPQTPLPTHSASTTAAPTTSTSPTPTPLAIALHLLSPASLLTSDSYTPLQLQVVAENCRPPCELQCTSLNPQIALVSPSKAVNNVQPYNASAPTNFHTSVWTTFRTCPGSGTSTTITCSSPAAPYVELRVDIQCRPSRWGLIADAIIILANGVYKSAWSPPVNVSEFESREEKIQASLVHSNAPPDKPFTVSLAAGARVLLVAAQRTPGNTGYGPFTAGTNVSLGAAPCNITWVADNGLYLEFEVPMRDELCPAKAPGHDCGYLTLVVTTETDSEANGVRLACPPFCPNDFPGSVPVALTQDDGSATNYMPGYESALQSPQQQRLQQLPTTGVYVTESCAAAGYLDPTVGVCTNNSDSRYRQCGFGSGLSCRPCPQGAMCPGGFRAWPLQGYYTSSESSGAVHECPPPGSQRCIGWSAVEGATACGHGYRASYAGCAACAPGYYPSMDGTCSLCSFAGQPSAENVILPMLEFGGILVATCALIYGVLRGIANLRAADTTQLLKRVAHLGAWTFSTLQLVAQVGQAASPGLPPVLLSIYTQLSLFQFQGVAVPSDCVPGLPFLNEVCSMSIALGLLLIASSSALRLSGKHVVRPGQMKLFSILFRVSILAAVLIYPSTTNSSLAMVTCEVVNVSAATRYALTGELSSGSIGRTDGDTVELSILHSNPTTACYVGAHKLVAGLAWATLVLYCIGFPVGVCALVGHAVSQRSNQAPVDEKSSSASRNDAPEAQAIMQTEQHPLLAPFTAGDYIPSRYWFFLVDRSSIFLLAVGQYCVASRKKQYSLAINCAVLLTGALLVYFFAPYHSHVRWKWIVKLFSLCLSVLATVLNYVAFSSPSSPVIAPLAIIAAIGCVLLFVVLVVAFFYDIIAGMPPMPMRLPSLRVPTDASSDNNGVGFIQANPLLVMNGQEAQGAEYPTHSSAPVFAKLYSNSNDARAVAKRRNSRVSVVAAGITLQATATKHCISAFMNPDLVSCVNPMRRGKGSTSRVQLLAEDANGLLSLPMESVADGRSAAISSDDTTIGTASLMHSSTAGTTATTASRRAAYMSRVSIVGGPRGRRASSIVNVAPVQARRGAVPGRVS